jgi:ribosomal protein L11 methyltransferase
VNPERWLVLTVESPSAELTPLLAEGLVACGGSAVEEDGALLRTYIAAPAGEPDAFVLDAQRKLSAIGGAPITVAWEWRAHEDWSERWKRGLGPRRVGARMIVTPTWRRPDTRAGDIVLAIDPEMAFGTGEHATTRAALRLLERALIEGASVLDIGTGSGILAIAAARLGAATVDAAECDAEALPYAEANMLRNGAVPAVRLHHVLVDDHYLMVRRGHYDVIVANVLSSVLRPLLAPLRRALRPRGALVLGGILVAEADEMREAASTAGLEVIEEDVEDEWWTVWLGRGTQVD